MNAKPCQCSFGQTYKVELPNLIATCSTCGGTKLIIVKSFQPGQHFTLPAMLSSHSGS